MDIDDVLVCFSFCKSEDEDDEGHFSDDSSATTVSLRSSSLKSTQLQKKAMVTNANPNRALR
ncbi:hypothetical protein Hanom_Chr14g01265771 [Helianthus anomalus]